MMAEWSALFVVNKKSPVSRLREFIAYANEPLPLDRAAAEQMYREEIARWTELLNAQGLAARSER